MSDSADKSADRLQRLLDLALASLKEDGDGEATLLLLQEAAKAADALPRVVVAAPAPEPEPPDGEAA